MQVAFLVLMFVVGAVMGSFLCCQVERMRRRELGEKKLGQWSVCLSCGKRLSWYENIPILSWIFLRGRCRKCHAKIGWAEIMAEVGCAVMELMLATTIDVEMAGGWEWAIWAFMVALSFALGFLAIYDGLYGELPTGVLTISAICAILVLILKQWSLFSVGSADLVGVAEALGGAVVLGGVYLLLYIGSKGRLVGDGDFFLAGLIGLTLGTPWLALIALTLANILACIVMAPVVVKRKNHMIYFGPFLVAAWVIVQTFSVFLTNLI